MPERQGFINPTSVAIGDASTTGARSIALQNSAGTLTIQATPSGATTLTAPTSTGTLMVGSNNLSSLTSPATARSNLGIGGIQTLTDAATITWNCANGLNARVTLAGNRTLAITNAAAGDTGTLIVLQDATGSRTLTLPSGSLVVNSGGGAVVLSTAANARDMLSWFFDGTSYYWTFGRSFT